ncbi:unnamed protein product [marine sediment metagenome]|uniref:Phosphoribosyltransferase domain-containing protein n=1 Tax=marine sediment metagenome TaxID=412755 RepID=X1D5P9_9ZZZZ
MNKTLYTWQDFDNDVQSILTHIKTEGWTIKQIYAIPRGSLALGLVLSNALGCELITKLEGKNQFYDNVLVVDDIVNSGKTLLSIPKIFLYNTVTLFRKEGSQFVPNKACRVSKKDDQVVFPWEPEDNGVVLP